MARKNPRDEKVISEFGLNVRKFRNAQGLTMNQLADLCDVEYGTISTIERGVVNCSISTAASLAKGLKVSMDDLFEGAI